MTCYSLSLLVNDRKGDGPGENIVKCGFGDGGLSEFQFCEQHPLFEWVVFE